MRMRVWFLLASLILAGCSSHAPPPSGHWRTLSWWWPSSTSNCVSGTARRTVTAALDRGGVDCSGFVYRTFRDRFDMQLPRSTEEQTSLGTKVSRDELMPGDLVFFKTGGGENGLHVGIYDTNDQFIHASTSRGVIRSSLDNVYWKRVYWQARRI